MSEENIIFVGKKPTMNYVLAIVTQFNNSDMPRIVIKARVTKLGQRCRT